MIYENFYSSLNRIITIVNKNICSKKLQERIFMNNVILIGRLVADPQVGASAANPAQGYARFRLAVDRRMRKDADPTSQHADFIDCVLFGQSVGSFQQLVHKGTKLAITGHLTSGSYQNKEGKTVYTTSVGVERWEFVEKKPDSQPQQPTYGQPQPQYAPAPQYAPQPQYTQAPAPAPTPQQYAPAPQYTQAPAPQQYTPAPAPASAPQYGTMNVPEGSTVPNGSGYDAFPSDIVEDIPSF